MASIRHVYTSPQADVGDPTLVQPSDWNSAHAYTLLDGVSLAGNTAGVLADITSGTCLIAGGNNITLSQNANSVTISAFNQTLQTQNRFNLTLSGNTDGVMAHVSSGTLTLAGGNNITLSQNGNAVTISAANETQTVPPIATTALSVASANSVGTVTRFAAEDHRHAGLYQISVGGNTDGATSAGAGSLMLAGGDNVTLSGATAGGGMTLSVVGGTAAGGAFKAGISTGGNTSGTSGTVASQLVLVGGNNITLSQSVNGASATVTLSHSNSAGPLYYIPTERAVSTTRDMSGSVSTIFLVHVQVPCEMTVQRVALMNSMQTNVTSAANNTTYRMSLSRGVALYSYNGTGLSRAASSSTVHTFSWTSNDLTNSFQAIRLHTISLPATIVPGNYWIAFSYSTLGNRSAAGGSSNTTMANSYYIGADAAFPAVSGIWGAAADTNYRFIPYQGIYSAQSAEFPATIGSGDVATALSVNMFMRLEGAISG